MITISYSYLDRKVSKTFESDDIIGMLDYLIDSNLCDDDPIALYSSSGKAFHGLCSEVGEALAMALASTR